MPPTNQSTSDTVIRVILQIPEYKVRAEELAMFIRSCHVHRIIISENEYWKIKGKTYRVVKDVFGINYRLITTGKNKKIEAFWLSELLPLSINDVMYVSGNKEKRSFTIGKPLKKGGENCTALPSLNLP